MRIAGLPQKRDRAQSHTGVGLIVSLALVIAGGLLHPSAPVHAQVDFEGIWVINPRPGVRGAPSEEEIRYTPAGRAEWERFGAEIDPSFRCIMPGIPRGFTDPYPIEIIQQDHQVVILHEYYHQVRRIFMDGRQAPDYWPNTLGGYSTGHWEGETLVVRTTHMSPDNLMDIHGRPFSGADDTYVIERFTREGDLLSRIAEVHDPTYYEAPFVITPRMEVYAGRGNLGVRLRSSVWRRRTRRCDSGWIRGRTLMLEPTENFVSAPPPGASTRRRQS